MFLQTIPVGKLHTNCYLIADDAGNGAIIDPGDHAQQLLRVALDNNICIRSVWLTHGHFDHLLAVSELLESTHAELYISEKDEPALTDARLNLLAYFSSNIVCSLTATRVLREGDVVYAGELPFTVWETPGHTEGSVCFVNEELGILFAGDTIFAEGYGRTDLPGGDEKTLQKSLKRLSAIEQPLKVYPGHGEAFTLGGDL